MKNQSIFIPDKKLNRALIIVDMQEGFLPSKKKWIIPNVNKLIQNGDYKLFVEAIFYANPNSLWDKQTNWIFKLEPTVQDIKQNLFKKNKIVVKKTSKSVFNGNKNLVLLLKREKIQEIHIVGVDLDDCVLATTFDSFDAGFLTYVIEECVESNNGAKAYKAALHILRNLNLTNHSLVSKSRYYKK